jgi:hypothetical protein
MGKTNWKLVFLGGLLAGVLLNILLWIAWIIYLGDPMNSALKATNPAFQETAGYQILWVIIYLVAGIITVWLYSAIRPRYGAGPKTAVIAGVMVWFLCVLLYDVASGSFGFFPYGLLVIDSITHLVMYVVAALAGAWVYKEQ